MRVFVCLLVLACAVPSPPQFFPKLKKPKTRLQLKIAEGDNNEELGNRLGEE